MFPVPDEQVLHERMLSTLPDTPLSTVMDDEVHLFTDGSTEYGKTRVLSFNSWSLMLATLGKRDSVCIASGCLPGVVQTNNRAELFAICQALRVARCGHIYTDSKYCVDGFRKLQLFGWVEHDWARSENYGLWKRAWSELRGAPNRWQIWKVKSHRRIEEASSDHDAWCILHNDAADKKAKQANRERSEKLCGLQQQVSQQARLSANIPVKSGADVAEDLWSCHNGFE